MYTQINETQCISMYCNANKLMQRNFNQYNTMFYNVRLGQRNATYISVMQCTSK